MDKHAFSDAEMAMIKRYLTTGAAIGGGGALLTAAINYINHLNKQQDSSKDDDTLYVYKNIKPGQVKAAGIGDITDAATGTALTGAILAAISTYALGHKFYNKFRKAQAQAELDEAQKAFIETQGYKVKNAAAVTPDASASAPAAEPSSPGALNLLTGSAFWTLPTLIMLAAGGGAWKFLDKSFPIKKKKVQKPRKIEIIDDPALAKQANAVVSSLEDSDACEFLMRVVLSEKKASSTVAEVVAAVAKEGPKPFMNAVENIGFNDSLDLVKGASAVNVHPFKEHIATCLLSKSARVGDLMGLTAAGEFAESHPEAMRAVSLMDDETKEAMFKLACIFGQACRAEVSEEFGIQPPKEDMEKIAFADTTFELLADQVSKNVDDADSTDTSGEEAGLSDPDSPSRKRKVKFVRNGKSSRRIMDGLPGEDIIDRILTPGSSELASA